MSRVSCAGGGGQISHPLFVPWSLEQARAAAKNTMLDNKQRVLVIF